MGRFDPAARMGTARTGLGAEVPCGGMSALLARTPSCDRGRPRLA
jgi:hypothetical protein